MPLLESKINSLIFSTFELSNSLISAVEQLPLRIQIIFGGNPKKATRLLKSLSLVTIVNPSILANSQTTESSDVSSLKSIICFDPAKVFAKNTASPGDRFWSNKSFIRRKVQFFLCLQHNSNRQECLLFQEMESLPESPQNSFQKRGSPIHQRQLCAYPLHKVCRFFFQAPELFFQVATWQCFYIQIYI